MRVLNWLPLARLKTVAEVVVPPFCTAKSSAIVWFAEIILTVPAPGSTLMNNVPFASVTVLPPRLNDFVVPPTFAESR